MIKQSHLETCLLQEQCTNHKEQLFSDNLNRHSRARLLVLSSRWQNRKIRSSILLIDTKTATTYRTTISENHLKSRTDFLQLRYKVKATLKWVGGVETKSSLDLCYSPFLMQWLTIGRVITTTKVIPEEWRVQTLAWGNWTRKGSPYNIWFWKPVGLTSTRPKELKKTQVVFFLSPGTEAAVWKAPKSHGNVVNWLILGYVLETGIFWNFLLSQRCWQAPSPHSLI